MKNTYLVDFDMEENYESFPILWSDLPEKVLNLPCSDVIINDTFMIQDDGELKSTSVAILIYDGSDYDYKGENYQVIETEDSEYVVPKCKTIEWDDWDEGDGDFDDDPGGDGDGDSDDNFFN